MRIPILFPLLLLSFASHAENNLQIVDVGFQDFDKHIVIELTTVNGEDGVKFGLGCNASGKSVPISKCGYTQKSLESEVNKIADPKVRADFKWIFFRSDHSATTIDQFYPEFKLLLERANPKCDVQELQRLYDQLIKRNG